MGHLLYPLSLPRRRWVRYKRSWNGIEYPRPDSARFECSGERKTSTIQRHRFLDGQSRMICPCWWTRKIRKDVENKELHSTATRVSDRKKKRSEQSAKRRFTIRLSWAGPPISRTTATIVRTSLDGGAFPMLKLRENRVRASELGAFSIDLKTWNFYFASMQRHAICCEPLYRCDRWWRKLHIILRRIILQKTLCKQLEILK